MCRPRILDVFAAALAVVVLAGEARAVDPSSTLIVPPALQTFGFRRATERELGLLLPGITLADPSGIGVARLRATDDPNKRTDDHEITIVAVDSGTGTVLASFGSMRIGSWNGKGESLGPLVNPTDIAIDRDGLVGVTDTGNRRVVVLRHDGKSLTAVTAYGSFLEPRGIAADGAGGFLVCDRARNAVIRLDAKTGARKTFGLEAAFDRPIDVQTIPEGDRVAKGKKRIVAVVDRDGARLRTFDPVGAVRATREASSLGFDGAAFDAVELDWHTNLYAVDRRGHRIYKLRDDLYPLDTWGSRGTGPGQFVSPRSIAIHRRFGQVFIAEQDGGQVLWVATDVRNLRAEPGDPATIEYLLTEESLVKIRILDSRGTEIAKLVDGARQPAGPQSGTWDGTSGKGVRVPAGVYVVEVSARATYASKTEFECRRTTKLTLAAR